jgi:hypothetical protein
MKKIVLLTLFSFAFILAYAQPKGNEWINYNQKYFAFKVAKSGIFRINFAALSNALSSVGIPINNTNPQKIQIFGRGVEQYLYITNESSGLFTVNDYIEFYAQANDGWLDSRLYKDSTWQINTEYSLFNDTATYFLTISNTVNNKRLTTDASSDFTNYTPANWFYSVSEQYYNDEYLDGAPIINTTGS